MEQLFIVLSGISGSGKSSLAEDMAVKTGAMIVASDDIRREMWGDAACQTDPHLVFAELHRRVRAFLRCGYSVIIDSTALTRQNRANLLTLTHGVNCRKLCCVVHAPIEECIARQNLRMRRVPEYAIERQAL